MTFNPDTQKILLLYTHNKSFLASFYYQLALALKEKGNEVLIFSLKAKYSNKEVPEIVKIDSKKGILKNTFKIFKTIHAYKPDVVISNFSYVNPALLSGRILGVKKNIVWFHTLTTQLQASRKQVWLKSLFLKLSSHIIVNSNFLKNDLVKNYGLSHKKIVSVPFWSSLKDDFSLNNSSSNSQKINIGCPGRIEKVKNQQLIVKFFSDIKIQQQFNLYFAGNGENLDSLKSEVEMRGLTAIEFMGVLSVDKMKEFYQNMDLIILPSKFEAFGLVFIEALSMGCAVLVSNQFGALTYINDEEFLKNYTFDPFSLKDLQTKVISILEKDFPPPTYFYDIYHRYFKKEQIVAQVEKILKS